MIGEVMKSASFRGGGLHGKGSFSIPGPTQAESWCCWSALRPICHGLDATSVNLNLMRLPLGPNGLTARYIRIAASLVAPAAPFFSRGPRRILVRASVGSGLFQARFGCFGWHWVCSASNQGARFGVTVRAFHSPCSFVAT